MRSLVEYWIVLAHQREVEVFRKPRDGRYEERRTVGFNEMVECMALPGVRVGVADLFA